MYRWFKLLGLTFLASALFLPAGPARAADPVILNYANFFTNETAHGQLGRAWAAEVEKRSQNRVKINYFPDGRLLQGDQVYQGVVSGVADLGMSVFAYNLGRFPIMSALDLPWGYKCGRQATEVLNRFHQRFQPEELKQVKVLYLHAHGPGLLHMLKPLKRMEELKGLRIRSTSFSAKLARALGATPVAMTQNGAFLALKNGLVQGTFSPMVVLKEWGQAQVIRQSLSSPHFAYTTGMYLVMNLKKWRALTPELQKIMEQVSREFPGKHARAWDAGDQEARLYSKKMGNLISSLTPSEEERWGKALRPVTKAYLQELGRKGLPSEKISLTIQELVTQFKCP